MMNVKEYKKNVFANLHENFEKKDVNSMIRECIKLNASQALTIDKCLNVQMREDEIAYVVFEVERSKREDYTLDSAKKRVARHMNDQKKEFEIARSLKRENAVFATK